MEVQSVESLTNDSDGKITGFNILMNLNPAMRQNMIEKQVDVRHVSCLIDRKRKSRKIWKGKIPSCSFDKSAHL